MGIYYSVRILQLLVHPFNGFFSRTTWVGLYQKGNTILDLNETRDDAVWGWQWHQLDHMQAICTSLQTDDHTNTSSLIICFQCSKTLLVRRQEEHRACIRLSDEYTAEIQSVFGDILWRLTCGIEVLRTRRTPSVLSLLPTTSPPWVHWTPHKHNTL